jgi:hypothetical protein
MGYQPVDHGDEDNYVRITQIIVQNSIDGGAAECKTCGDSVSINRNSDNCISCDPNVDLQQNV